MKTIIAAAVIAVSLTSCTAMQQDEAKACIATLYAARVATMADLLQVAQATPACMSLGIDAMQVSVKNAAAARGIR